MYENALHICFNTPISDIANGPKGIKSSNFSLLTWWERKTIQGINGPFYTQIIYYINEGDSTQKVYSKQRIGLAGIDWLDWE